MILYRINDEEEKKKRNNEYGPVYWAYSVEKMMEVHRVKR